MPRRAVERTRSRTRPRRHRQGRREPASASVARRPAGHPGAPCSRQSRKPGQTRARHPVHLCEETASRLQGHPHQPRAHRLRRRGLILEKLSEQAALDTLEELATHNPLLAKTNEAERLVLYRETGSKPLLLRWTAGQLGRGHCLTFTDVLHFLRSCPEGNDPLEFIFGDLVEDFSDAETKALCALTYFALPAKVEHIHAIADPSKKWKDPDEWDFSKDEKDEENRDQKEELSITAVEIALRSLVNRSLTVPTDELKAFTIVPMVADFLRKKNPEVVTEVGDRIEKRAYALIIENGYESFDRFPILEAAWSSIAPALALFVAADNVRLQIVCNALQSFFRFTALWDAGISLSEKAEAKAVATADHNMAGWRAYDASYMYYLRRQADAVLACAGCAAAHGDAANAGACERARPIRLGGMGHQLKSDYPAAIVTYREALGLHRSFTTESVEVSIYLIDLANAEQLSGDYAAAEKHYQEALRVAYAVGFVEGVANITGNLAKMVLDRNDWPAAEALSVSEAIHRQDLIAAQSYYLALVLVRQGKAVEALPYARRAVAIFTRLGDPELANAQATLAECEGSQ